MENTFKAGIFSKAPWTQTRSLSKLAQYLEITGPKKPIRNKNSWAQFVRLWAPPHTSVCLIGKSLRILLSFCTQTNHLPHMQNKTVTQRMALPTSPKNIPASVQRNHPAGMKDLTLHFSDGSLLLWERENKQKNSVGRLISDYLVDVMSTKGMYLCWRQNQKWITYQVTY